jgi:hypothetical protein
MIKDHEREQTVPERPNFVFMYVGNHLEEPTMLVSTIKKTNPNAVVYQCTDRKSPLVDGVDHAFRASVDSENLMTARLQLFSKVNLTEPAIYLDTDMLVIQAIRPKELLSNRRFLVCRRNFNRDIVFNVNQRGLNFNEYQGMSLDQVYPYLACTTISKDSSFWEQCHHILLNLNPKFYRWYGDQEALKRMVMETPRDEYGELSEEKFGCLPEYVDSQGLRPAILHFKGPARKELMRRAFRILTTRKIQQLLA